MSCLNRHQMIICVMVTQKSFLELFEDEEFVEKVKKILPQLFQIAEIECSRAGKIGMEVGNLRERILVSMMILW